MSDDIDRMTESEAKKALRDLRDVILWELIACTPDDSPLIRRDDTLMQPEDDHGDCLAYLQGYRGWVSRRREGLARAAGFRPEVVLPEEPAPAISDCHHCHVLRHRICQLKAERDALKAAAGGKEGRHQ